MRHVSLYDSIDTPSHTPAHTWLLERTPPYNTVQWLEWSCQFQLTTSWYMLANNHWEHSLYAPETATNQNQMGSKILEWPSWSISKSNNCSNNTETEWPVCCLQILFSLIPDYKKPVDDITKLVVHHEKNMQNRVVPTFHELVAQDAELFILALTHTTLGIYMLYKVIVRFDSEFGNICDLARGHLNSMADTDGARRSWVYKEWEFICIVSGFIAFL